MKIIKIQSANESKKYAAYIGKQFTVNGGIDNHGDYCIAVDKGQPFMFIAAKDCMVVRDLTNP